MRSRRRGALFLIVDVGCGRHLLPPAQQVGQDLFLTCYVGKGIFRQLPVHAEKLYKIGATFPREKIMTCKSR
jgi:hypothetical protein